MTGTVAPVRAGLSRRQVLRAALVGGGGALVGGCTQSAEPQLAHDFLSRHHEFTMDGLAARTVPATPFLVSFFAAGGNTVAAFHPGIGRFVRPPKLDGTDRPVRALSPDGTTVAVNHLPAGGSVPGVILHTLSTGDERRFDPREGVYDLLAAFSPDGGSLAVLSSAPDPDDPDPVTGQLAVVSVIDIATGGRRRLWSRRGGSAGDSAVGWSPDGRRIAVTYAMDADEDEEWAATVVVDVAGNQIAHQEAIVIMPPDNAAWLDDNRILCFPHQFDDWHQEILDLRNGRRTAVSALAVNPYARFGPRVLIPGGRTEHDPITVLDYRMDGAEPRPFLTIHGQYGLDRCFLV